MNEIQELKARIEQIDKQIGDLQSERLLKGMRFQLLLQQAPKSNPTVTLGKQMAQWYDDAVGAVGCKEKTL